MNETAPLKKLIFIVKETTSQLQSPQKTISPDEALTIALEAEKELLQYKRRRSKNNTQPIILKQI